MMLLFGGETTVKFPSQLNFNHSKGGRNQELILSAFLHLKEQTTNNLRNFVLFSLGTDGEGFFFI